MGRLLGKGEFGIVHRATLEGRTVAVKQLKPGATTTQAQDFIEECCVMKAISANDRSHPNVMPLIGVTLQVRPLLSGS